MGRKRDTVDIVKALVALMTPTILINSQIDNGDGTYTLNISNTYWLRLTKIIDIGAVNYLVESFIINESITVSPVSSSDSAPAITSFILPAPHFLHGTVEEAAVDQQKDMAENNRLPFVYLIEPLEETDIKDEEVIWGRESRPRLYFMDASLSTWNPPTHKTNVVEPIRQMIDLFFDKIKEEEDNLYKEVLKVDSIAAPNWGKFVINKGYKGKFFADIITGLQVDFDFTMSKTACEDIVASTECPLQLSAFPFAETIDGANDGKALATATNVIGNATYSWTGPGGFTSTDRLITNLTPGVYIVTATDSNSGCEKTVSVTVDAGGVAPDCDMTIVLTPSSPSTVGGSDGSIFVTVLNNVGAVTFLWSDESTANPIENIGAGPFGVCVTDAGVEDCKKAGVTVVEDPPPTELDPEDLINLILNIDAPDQSSLNDGLGMTNNDPISKTIAISPATEGTTQTTVGDQPTWIQDGMGTNNLARIRFVRSTGQSLETVYGHFGSYSFVFVIMVASDTDGMNLFDNVLPGGIGPRLFINHVGASMMEVRLATTGNVVSTDQWLSSDPVIISGAFDGATNTASVKINDGVLTSLVLPNNALNTLTIGARANNAALEAFDGYMGQGYVYSDHKTEAERDLLVKGSNTKFGIF